ncbi:alpha/beta hydrolase [Aquihabitans sp. G128]|uniref:alpha/beta fold hydrolase n=1 Tax=Aquihabitans sp. G128 TaxID=2849779 RepID=UPI001C2213B0|nr:alpha/beta hydrolase [Aquihabitans sp. G128]QXC61156.1 alpha/beta hydrolase [Aquihabitans sp. G128]
MPEGGGPWSDDVLAAAAAEVAAWEAGGERIAAGDDQVWFRVLPATADAGNLPLLVLHGFPTCSFDWRLVVDRLRAERDVIVLDLVGFGLSSKPDQRYGLRGYADGVEAVVAHLELEYVDLVTHDLGDSVGGELLARSLDGTLGFGIGRRVLTNGSIYIDMAQLTVGQQLLLGLPDEQNDLVGADEGVSFANGVAGTFADDAEVPVVELAALAQLARRDGGLSLLPRTIRYIEDRRAEERRFTGAIEVHPSPVGVVWGDQDPVAVHAMAEHFVEARPDTALTTLEGVGHYPMVESPERFADAVLAMLDGLEPLDPDPGDDGDLAGEPAEADGA